MVEYKKNKIEHNKFFHSKLQSKLPNIGHEKPGIRNGKIFNKSKISTTNAKFFQIK